MRAYIGEDNSLNIFSLGEDLTPYSSFKELVEICFPNLIPVDPQEIQAKTDAPIFKWGDKVWWFPTYQENDPLEVLRDNGTVRLENV